MENIEKFYEKIFDVADSIEYRIEIEQMEKIYEEIFEIADAIKSIRRMEKQEQEEKDGWVDSPIVINVREEKW